MPNWKSYESSVRLLSAIIAAHPTLKLDYGEISARFGGDCTKSAIDNRFRRLKSDAKLINNAIQNGVDPITINVGDTDGKLAMGSGGGGGRGSEIARCFGTDATPKAVNHAVARIVKPAVKMIIDTLTSGGDPKDIAQAIAGNFGDGDNSVKKTPAKRTPKKKPSTKATDGDDDEGSMIETPSKSTLKKVKGGRIGKATSSRGRAKNYTEPDEEDDDEVEMQGTTNLKEEDDEDIDISSPGFGNGNGHNSNGHGHAYIKSDHGDHDGYDGEELYFEAINDDDEA